jgi:hypothetical protein
MTEEQIERQVEIRMDRLDRQLMNGGLSQNSYDMAVEDLDKWASVQYHAIRSLDMPRYDRRIET